MVVVFPLCTVDDWALYPYGPLHRMVARAAAADGFEVVDLLPVYARRPPRELRLADSDAHPNEEGHRVAAEAIAARLLPQEDRLFQSRAASRRSERPSAPSGP